VSGGDQGLEAAQTTVTGLLGNFFATPDTWETTVVLNRLIGAQNAWLADHNRRRQGTGGSAALTTLTALALQGQTWTLAHVGDSRAWLLRAGAAPADGHAAADELMQLSTDQWQGQGQGQGADAGSDLYALGATLYQCLTVQAALWRDRAVLVHLAALQAVHRLPAQPARPA
jgi:hypothetical protein